MGPDSNGVGGRTMPSKQHCVDIPLRPPRSPGPPSHAIHPPHTHPHLVRGVVKVDPLQHFVAQLQGVVVPVPLGG